MSFWGQLLVHFMPFCPAHLLTYWHIVRYLWANKWWWWWCFPQWAPVATQMRRQVRAWRVTCCFVCSKWWTPFRRAALTPNAEPSLSDRRATDTFSKLHTNESTSVPLWPSSRQFLCSVRSTPVYVVVGLTQTHTAIVASCHFRMETSFSFDDN